MHATQLNHLVISRYKLSLPSQWIVSTEDTIDSNVFSSNILMWIFPTQSSELQINIRSIHAMLHFLGMNY